MTTTRTNHGTEIPMPQDTQDVFRYINPTEYLLTWKDADWERFYAARKAGIKFE